MSERSEKLTNPDDLILTHDQDDCERNKNITSDIHCSVEKLSLITSQ